MARGLLTAALLCAVACGTSDQQAEGSGAGASGNHETTGGSPGDNGSSGTGGLADIEGDFEHDAEETGGESCQSAESRGELMPIYLAFAFDVSGSMGKLDHPYWWHDPEQKWEPVAEATREFFADENAVNIDASMTFFPRPGGQGPRCNPSNYEDPDVARTTLPSTAFGQALDGYEQEVSGGSGELAGGDWRGGTPTLAVVQGILTHLESHRAADPNALFALVLITDGLPQSCNDDSIESVAQELAAVASSIPTYVIGVENAAEPPGELPAGWPDWGPGNEPQDPPETMEALHDLAAAGGTESAFLIWPDDPVQTKHEFRRVIDEIRERTVSCEIARPVPPDGQVFDPERVNVRYESASGQTPLLYDPECEGTDSWRYQSDDTSVLELCPATCNAVRADAEAAVQVEFGCRRRHIVR